MSGGRQAPAERVSIRHPPGLSGLELMRATYLTQTFPRHSHEGFGVGVIERGALGFFYRGEHVVAPAGRINLVNPDEVHTGQSAAEDGWTYRMFYLGADLLQRAASEMSNRPVPLPFFTAGVIDDDRLAGLIHQAHLRLADPAAPLLERESRLLHMLVQLIARHADAPPPLRPIGREHRGVARAMELIAASFAEDLSIDQLAAAANLSPYHFIRVFSRRTGLPPHAWLMQFRAFKARRMLAEGVAIADAACLSGFTDQSHLTRIFKRLLGYTPGQFSNSVQDD
jgi:AraC-like DNA-binding protein